MDAMIERQLERDDQRPRSFVDKPFHEEDFERRLEQDYPEEEEPRPSEQDVEFDVMYQGMTKLRVQAPPHSSSSSSAVTREKRSKPSIDRKRARPNAAESFGSNASALHPASNLAASVAATAATGGFSTFSMWDMAAGQVDSTASASTDEGIVKPKMGRPRKVVSNDNVQKRPRGRPRNDGRQL
jgi:hypothetical protein